MTRLSGKAIQILAIRYLREAGGSLSEDALYLALADVGVGDDRAKRAIQYLSQVRGSVVRIARDDAVLLRIPDRYDTEEAA
jgi:hypothetical protein